MRFLTVIVYVVSSLVFGVIMMALSANILTADILAVWVNDNILANSANAVVCGLVGGLMVLLCLNKIQRIIFYSRKEKMIKLETPGGPVNITVLAVEDMIKKTLEKKGSIAKVKPRVVIRKNKLVITIRGYLTAAVNLLEFSQDVQAKVNDKLRGTLGDSQKVDVIVEIRKMISTGKKEEEKEREVEFNYF